MAHISVGDAVKQDIRTFEATRNVLRQLKTHIEHIREDGVRNNALSQLSRLEGNAQCIWLYILNLHQIKQFNVSIFAVFLKPKNYVMSLVAANLQDSHEWTMPSGAYCLRLVGSYPSLRASVPAFAQYSTECVYTLCGCVQLLLSIFFVRSCEVRFLLGAQSRIFFFPIASSYLRACRL